MKSAVLFASLLLFAFVCTTLAATKGAVCGTTKDSTYYVSHTIETINGVKYRRVKSSGCPGYDWTSRKNPGDSTVQNYDYYMPVNPTYSKQIVEIGVTLTTGSSNSQAIGGPLGIATNGVAIFGNTDAQNRDAYIYEGVSFDNCGGHPNQDGSYHYHAETKAGCVYNENINDHSPLFGFMVDGFPIYGVRGDNGTIPADLDECNGHVDATHPFYHYHATHNYQYPYLVNCLRGCIAQNSFNTILKQVAQGKCDPDTTKTYDYSSLDNAFTVASASHPTLTVILSLCLIVVLL